MRIRLIICLLFTESLPALAEAQLIQVERGYIRAPFVRVQRGRGRRARVRAPFVDVGGRDRQPTYQQSTVPGYEPPIEPTPVGPATAKESESPQERQRGRLIMAAGRLKASLSRMQNGNTWVNYLRLPDSVYGADELAADHVALQEQSAASRLVELQPVLSRFDSVNSDSRYRAVTELPEFQSTYHHLAEYVELLSERTPDSEPMPTVDESYLQPIRPRGSKRD